MFSRWSSTPKAITGSGADGGTGRAAHGTGNRRSRGHTRGISESPMLGKQDTAAPTASRLNRFLKSHDKKLRVEDTPSQRPGSRATHQEGPRHQAPSAAIVSSMLGALDPVHNVSTVRGLDVPRRHHATESVSGSSGKGSVTAGMSHEEGHQMRGPSTPPAEWAVPGTRSSQGVSDVGHRYASASAAPRKAPHYVLARQAAGASVPRGPPYTAAVAAVQQGWGTVSSSSTNSSLPPLSVSSSPSSHRVATVPRVRTPDPDAHERPAPAPSPPSIPARRPILPLAILRTPADPTMTTDSDSDSDSDSDDLDSDAVSHAGAAGKGPREGLSPLSGTYRREAGWSGEWNVSGGGAPLSGDDSMGGMGDVVSRLRDLRAR